MGIRARRASSRSPLPEGCAEAMLQGSPTAQTDGNVVMLPLSHRSRRPRGHRSRHHRPRPHSRHVEPWPPSSTARAAGALELRLDHTALTVPL
jgi:hypothetical protein